MAETPLLHKTIKCPACETPVPFRIANPRLYTVAGRESDRHVTGYRWIHGLVTAVVPHHYKVWQCAKCLFADLSESVEQHDPGPDFEAIRRTFVDISIEKRMVLDMLRDLVPEGDMDGNGAIALHLSALLIAGLPCPERAPEHGKRGRLALALAWLYRERNGGPALPAPVTESPALTALGESAERLNQLLADSSEALRDLQRQGDLRAQELGLTGPDATHPYFALCDLIAVRLKALQSEVATLQGAVLQDHRGPIPQVASSAPADSGSLDRVLNSILTFWPDLPRNETQSLRLAVEAFQNSYQFEGDAESVEQGVAQVNIILDILIRLGELDQALAWTTQISKYASDTIGDLNSRLAKAKGNGTLTTYDATVIGRKVAALGLTQRKAGESRREILELMRERDRDTINRILDQTAQLPAPEKTKALLAAGIHDGVLALLSREVAPVPKDGPGWFKGLFQD